MKRTIPRRPSPLRWIIPLAACLAAAVVFSPALRNGFVDYDDKPHIAENPHIRGLGAAELKWMFTTGLGGPYMPLSWLSLAVDYRFWGLDPKGYHLTNILLHVLNVLLVYFLALRLLRAARTDPKQPGDERILWGAGFAALLFGIHPLRVESVAWAIERKDVLSGLFYLASVLLYLRRRLAASVACCALSLLAKPMAMTMPLVLLILDVYPLRRMPAQPAQWLSRQAWPLWLEKAPYLAAALAASILAYHTQARFGAVRSLAHYDLAMLLAQPVYGLAFYLWKSLVPLSLTALYEIPHPFDPWAAPFLLSGAVVILVSLTLFLARKRFPAGLAVWCAYAAILLPVLGFVPFGKQIAADRYTYLACAGWAVLGGAGLTAALRRGRGAPWAAAPAP
ncbi:MAG: hypothetical protein PHU21_03320, partial [Elusimicrobia bacterium]|nr:hypothetical protein [Elusimicrobiota bacterium]